MIVTKKAIPRRTVLRGLGAAVALPFLDSMVPAFAGVRNAVARSVNRLSIVYMPNGMNMDHWTPKTDGAAFELTRILEALRAFREQMIVVTGLDNEPAVILPGEPPGFHARSGGAFLSGAHPKPTDGADLQAGTTFDQIAARRLGQETQLASLEVGLESAELSGTCEPNLSCAYVNTIAWRTPTTPLPTENNPRAVFERLFGDGHSTDLASRRMRIREDRSILDSVTEKVSRLKGELGSDDKAKLSEYLEAIRDAERRIQKAEREDARELPAIEKPGGVPTTFEEHIRLMFDLQVLAYQGDLTRVITFMVGRELSPLTYPQVGVPDSHHAVSHHENESEKLEKLAKINVFQIQQFAYFLQKLRDTRDGDGSLLDHLMLVYGAGMSDSNTHDPHNLPILLLGGGAGQLKGGRHLRYPKGTPLTNLWMTLLHKLDAPVERIGDSTGLLSELSA